MSPATYYLSRSTFSKQKLINVNNRTIGDKPIVKDPPKISGKVVSGERVQLTCAVAGNGSFEYFWIHDNQTLVKEAGFCSQSLEAELSIKEMTAANQGEYKCHFINSYGFCVSEPVSLQLGTLLT